MIYHLPDYYEKFNCIADSCPDSCCRGWRTIEVDNRSYEKYQLSEHEFAGSIIGQLKTIDDKHFFKLEDGKCPFLNEDNLCDIILNMGDKMLCTTCATYPRFVYTKGNETYACLTMSCPHAAKMILCHDEPTHIITFNDEDYVYNTENIETIKLMHEQLDIPIWMKLALLALVPINEESYYDNYAMDILRSLKGFPAHSDIRIQLGLEYLTLFKRLAKKTDRMKDINEMLDKYVTYNTHDIVDNVECLMELYDSYEKYIVENKISEIENEFRNYIVYKLFRSIPHVISHDDFYDELFMIIMSSVSIFMIQAMLWNEKGQLSVDDRIKIFQCHAKTFEHSEKMQIKTKEKFKNDGYMTPAVMLALIVPQNRY